MAFWRLHCHLVWGTYGREPFIDAARETLIHQTLFGKAKELGMLIHAVGGIEDHTHVVTSIAPRLSVATCVGQLKGASSHRVNVEFPDEVFRWQGGYGALSIGGRSLASVIAYVRNQREHHRTGTTIAVYERCTDEEDGVVIVGNQ